MTKTRCALALVISVLATLAGIPLAGHANAAVVLTCEESGTVSWAGLGIGALPSKVYWTDAITFSNCTGTAVDQGLPIPVSETDIGTETAGCDAETTDNTSTGTIIWSDGTSTDVSSGGGSQIEGSGSRRGDFPTLLSTGPYAGKTAIDSNTVTPSDQQCPGLTFATLEGTWTIAD
ncbi:hypothetical protein AB0B25_16280 [Nocardia sp. NPDC049190]|uniref:hypothetical protein n=1 Tax=Nocardia sp. NPDC049190 TaxID=3155650 RepID=UPI0033EF44F8